MENRNFVENIKKIFESMANHKITYAKIDGIEISRDDVNRYKTHTNPETTDELMAGMGSI
jgi:hypothetical protein